MNDISQMWVIGKEMAVDVGLPRPELMYAVFPQSSLWDNFTDASNALREAGLPIGWVAMQVHQLLAVPQMPIKPPIS